MRSLSAHFFTILLVNSTPTRPDTVVIDEMGIRQGKTRIDVAVINGQLHGYEIKSERDNLRRLTTQATTYGMVFDRMTLVCGDRHLLGATEIVPVWWEILKFEYVEGCLAFQRVREGMSNPRKNARALAEFLWLKDAMALVGLRNSLRGLRGRPKAVFWGKVCELFSTEEIADAVRTHLKATAGLRGHRVR